ncbi:MAG: hypothetical protein OSJ74_09580, partial [Clostridia bacterium]|nr:hypothetical protein [Clostridia bacterium]
LTEQAFMIAYEHCASLSFAMDDMTEILNGAKRLSVLSCGEILKVGRLLRAARLIGGAISPLNDDRLGDIKALLIDLCVDNELESSIASSILGENEVSDNASSALKSMKTIGRAQVL